jgi:type I restriction enzyme S subunit
MSIVGTVGQTAIVDERFVGWNTARAVAVIPVRADIGAHWIRLALKTPKVQAQINSRLNTTVQATLNLRDVSQLPIALPPLRERRAVASVLAPLDDKIELNRRMNETLEAMAGAIFKDWFVDFGPTRAKEEGRAPYLAADAWSLFPDRLDYEGKPEGWAKRPIGDFAELRGGKQLEKERITTNGKIPVFGGAGLMGFTDEHNADGFVISVGRVGAYCGKFFSRRGKAWINNNASLIRPFDRISGEWLFLSLQNADIEVIKKGAAQPFVSNTDVANMPVIWPGEIIMRRFAEVAVPLILKVEQNEAETSALAGTRDFLLPKLMSGEVHVKDAERIIGEAT